MSNTSLKLTNFPPCGYVKLNDKAITGLQSEITDTVTVTIPSLNIGTHKLEVFSGLDTNTHFTDIVICKDSDNGTEKKIDLSRFFCTLCIDGFDMNYKLYVDNNPSKYYATNNGIITGIAQGKHNLLFKSKDDSFEREVDIRNGYNKINVSKIPEDSSPEEQESMNEEVNKLMEELGKINTVKVSKSGIKIVAQPKPVIEKPRRDVFIPPPLPRIKAKRVESIDSNISIPLPVEDRPTEIVAKNSNPMKVVKTTDNLKTVETFDSGNIEQRPVNNVVDINSVRQSQANQPEFEQVNVSEGNNGSVIGKVGLGGIVAASIYFLFKK